MTKFDESYFRSGNYTDFKVGKTSKYFWARRFYAALVLRYRSGGRLLEIGPGMGHLLARLQDHFEAYGADISEFAIEQAGRVATRADLRVLPAERLGEFGPEYFDVIVGLHVIEHLPDPAKAIATLYEIMRPGGLLVMTTPNLTSPMRKLKGDQWHGFRDPTHISMKEPAAWQAMVRAAGFTIRRSFGDGFWDTPYVKYVPAVLQTAFFGAPAVIQTLAARPLLPVVMSENLIIIAEKK